MATLLTLKVVMARTTYSQSQIYRLESAGDFPKRITIGRGRVAWLEHEIDDWIDSRANKRQYVPLTAEYAP
jgi:prophage regulatory protein